MNKLFSLALIALGITGAVHAKEITFNNNSPEKINLRIIEYGDTTGFASLEPQASETLDLRMAEHPNSESFIFVSPESLNDIQYTTIKLTDDPDKSAYDISIENKKVVVS